MTRRSILGSIPAAVLGRRLAFGRDAATAATAYRDYSRCFPEYLRMLAARAYERRNGELARLTSSEAIGARQRWARETFWTLVGGRPERTPLNARSLASFDRPGYRVEKIVYESRPGFHITANLYVPLSGAGRFPAVLFQMGHATNGKAYPPYQRCCQALAKLGFVVLAFDPDGQGERVYYPGADPSRSRLPSADDEHTVPGWQMLLYGDTMSRLQVWDAIRSLDYLAGHPLVDPARIASTGQSGGGTLTMLLACADERLATAFVACGNTENFACADFNPPGSTDDAEQDFIGSGAAGFDRWDLLYPIAPKPLMIAVSEKDWFGTYSPSYLTSGREEFEKLERIYKTLEHPDHLGWTGTPLPHGLEYDTRMRLYNWFLRWLQPGAAPVEREPVTAPENDMALRVTASGSTVHSFGSLTPFRMNAELKPARSAQPLAEIVGAHLPQEDTRFAVVGRTFGRDVDIEAVEVTSDAQVWLPAWLFLPRAGGGSNPVYVLLEPGTRNARWHEGELYQELARAGSIVCVPNLRGIGDLTPEFGRSTAEYARSHATEENYAWASLILGKPMLGQWVTDVLAVLAAVRQRGRRIVLAAAGKLTVPALMAAALDGSLAGVHLNGGVISFQSVVETENYRHSFANFVPGLLRHTDLPEIAGTLKTKLVLAGPVDGAGSAAVIETVQRLYPAARILPQAGWDTEALKTWDSTLKTDFENRD